MQKNHSELEYKYPTHLVPLGTSSNLLEPLQCGENKVCTGHSHEFTVVRLY